MTLLDIVDLDAGYGDVQILENVNLSVEEGEYVSIIGPNGAGKSTLLKSIFGLTTRMSGSVAFKGDEITELDPVEITELGVGFIPQEGNIFPDLTVQENLRMGGYSLEEIPDEALNDVYDRFPVLEERKNQRAGSMSGGQRQMLAISRALIKDPDLLILDEPSFGLAPDLVQEMFEDIDRINESGTPVLVVEQNANEVMRRADRGYVLSQGQVRTSGPADELRNSDRIRKQFFGA